MKKLITTTLDGYAIQNEHKIGYIVYHVVKITKVQVFGLFSFNWTNTINYFHDDYDKASKLLTQLSSRKSFA